MATRFASYPEYKGRGVWLDYRLCEGWKGGGYYSMPGISNNDGWIFGVTQVPTAHGPLVNCSPQRSDWFLSNSYVLRGKDYLNKY